MSLPSRRAFLGTSLVGFTAAVVGHNASFKVAPPSRDPALAQGPEVAPPPRAVDPVPDHLDPQDTLFLTWQRDPTTTMTIQWVGPQMPADTAIRFAPRPGDQWQTAKLAAAPFPKTNFKVHRCELNGLTPGTEYVFQIGNESPTYKFRTAPAKATDTFTFVSGGDCGVNPHSVANNILAAKQEPFFALLGGDLGYDNGVSASTSLRFLQNYAKYMIDPQGRLIPMVTCVGNHEVKGGYTRKREDATFYFPLFDGLYRDTSFAALDFGDYLSLVLLDSGHVAPIGGDQSDWLARALKAREGRPHLIAANHVPAYPSARSPQGAGTGLAGFFGIPSSPGTGEENRSHWCPLFERYGVDAVLEHHDHAFKRTHPLTGGMKDKYGVPYLGDGSWGQIRTPAPIEKRPYLARLSKSYHLTLHQLEGERRCHVALEESGRVADVFTTNGKRPARRG